MALDPEISGLLAMLAQQQLPKLQELSPAEARLAYLRTTAAFGGDKPALVSAEDRTMDGPAGPLRLRVYSPPRTDFFHKLPGIVFFHGGGWVIGDLDSHDTACRSLCLQSGTRIVAVDYRLAPEHRYPAAVEDCRAATAWVAAHTEELGIDPARLAVAGDSAGGNLAAIVALHARDNGPALVFQLLIYPATDHRQDTRSAIENAHGYLLERETMDWFTAHYAPNPDIHDPDLFPLVAPDHSGLPRAHVVTAGYDPLRDAGRAYAARLAEGGNDVRLREYKTLVHGFLTMEGVSSAARAAIADCAEALREALS